jgi:hypothetical protein
VSETGLSAEPSEYRSRLEALPDEQVDAWAAELMRDMSIRRGVLSVIAEFRHAAHLDEAGLQRVFSAGGGASATVGRTADGKLMVPAISLHYFVTGIRHEAADARERLIAYLVANFNEIVYI